MKIKTFKEYINERVYNYIKSLNTRNKEDQVDNYKDEIWSIFQNSYSSIGGFKTAKNWEELKEKIWLFKMVKRNGKITAVKGYKDKLGRKTVCGGTDGSEMGKNDLYMLIKEDIKMGRSWGEVSGKMEHIMVNKFNAVPVPNIYAEKILNKPIKNLDKDGYHYTRSIGGEDHVKVLVVANDENLDLIKKEIEKG